MLEKKRKDYAFWRQFNEKPSVIPGCPGIHFHVKLGDLRKQLKVITND